MWIEMCLYYMKWYCTFFCKICRKVLWYRCYRVSNLLCCTWSGKIHSYRQYHNGMLNIYTAHDINMCRRQSNRDISNRCVSGGVHYIMSKMAPQITSLAIVYSTVLSATDQRKHQSTASLAFVRGIHRWPVNSPHKGPVTLKMFPFDDVIMNVNPNSLEQLCEDCRRIFTINSQDRNIFSIYASEYTAFKSC